MMSWIERRKKSGMNQFQCARVSGVSRMRLSLAETGHLKLTAVEEAAVHRVLTHFISERAREIRQLLREQDSQHAAEQVDGVA